MSLCKHGVDKDFLCNACSDEKHPENVAASTSASVALFQSALAAERTAREAAEQRVRELEAALEFYANSWVTNAHGSLNGSPGRRLLQDMGRKACEALAPRAAKVLSGDRKKALEEAAEEVLSGRVDVVYRYTPFPHNQELRRNPLIEIAENIRALATPPAAGDGGKEGA
jgi:hypothetical protein